MVYGGCVIDHREILMWTVIKLHEQEAAICFEQNGWSMMVHKMPGATNRRFWLSLNTPSDGSFKIDQARPPFFYFGEVEYDSGSALLFQLMPPLLDFDMYNSADDRISSVIWHGDLTDARCETLSALCRCLQIRADVFLKPRSTISLQFSSAGAADTIRHVTKVGW